MSVQCKQDCTLEEDVSGKNGQFENELGSTKFI